MKHWWYIVVMLFACVMAQAAETYIVGTVSDALTGEAIPNATIVFRGTKVGTSTQSDGWFYLHVNLQVKATLKVSAIGYRTETYTIEPGQDVGLDIMLQEKQEALSEVVVLPGANPALALMDSVRKYRRLHQATQPIASTVQDEGYLSRITSKHLSRRIWRTMQSAMELQADSTYLLPLPEELYGGVSAQLPEHIDLYASTIAFGEVSLLSPTANSGGAYYSYYLIDSLSSPKRYVVDFRPKNGFDALLTGSMTIDSATYAIGDVRASIAPSANINYLSAMQYERNDSTQRLTAVLDFASRLDSSHIFPSLLIRRTGILAPATADISKEDAPAAIAQDSVPHSTLSTPLLNIATFLAKTIHTGYIPTGTCVDIGRLVEVISYSSYEGLHIGLPLRTNAKLIPNVSLEGYVAYGLRDRGVKYLAKMQVILPTERRNVMSVSWWDHYADEDVSSFDALVRENTIAYGAMPFTMHVFRSAFYRPETAACNAVRNREFRWSIDSDWRSSEGSTPAVETRLSVQMGRMGYGDANDYHYYDMPSYRYNAISAMVRLGWQERIADIYLTRKHLYSTLPTLFLGAEMGSWRYDDAPEGRYRMYGKLQLLLRHDASLGMGGMLHYSVQSGIVIGNVPRGLLQQVAGNQGVTFAPERFTFVNYRSFAADKYLMVHANWNGRGILFNRIPGVRHLRLHELLEAKMAWGSGELAKEPYAEVGVGLGNILRVAEVYSIWKLTHRDDPGTARWGIRFRLHIGM